ncbi:MAG: LapA family protein [Pseudomonadota bacterium]
MNFILRLIPLPVLMFLGGLVFLAAAGAHAHYEWQKGQALDVGPPATVSAADVGEVQSFPWYEEVVVMAQIDDDLTYVYWEDTNQGTIEYPVMFFVDPNHTGPVREVLGAIAFNTSEEDRMIKYLESVQQGEGERGLIYRMTGTPAFMHDVTDEEIEWAAADMGVTLAENFLFLDPYFQGRAARLEPQPILTYLAAGLGIGLIWLAMIAQIIKRKIRRRQAERQIAGGLAKKGMVAAGGAVVGAMLGGDGDNDYV